MGVIIDHWMLWGTIYGQHQAVHMPQSFEAVANAVVLAYSVDASPGHIGASHFTSVPVVLSWSAMGHGTPLHPSHLCHMLSFKQANPGVSVHICILQRWKWFWVTSKTCSHLRWLIHRGSLWFLESAIWSLMIILRFMHNLTDHFTTLCITPLFILSIHLHVLLTLLIWVLPRNLRMIPSNSSRLKARARGVLHRDDFALQGKSCPRRPRRPGHGKISTRT